MVCEEGRHLLSANPETATVASRTSSREHSDNYLFLTGLAPRPPSQTKPLHGERSPFLSEKKKKRQSCIWNSHRLGKQRATLTDPVYSQHSGSEKWWGGRYSRNRIQRLCLGSTSASESEVTHLLPALAVLKHQLRAERPLHQAFGSTHEFVPCASIKRDHMSVEQRAFSTQKYLLDLVYSHSIEEDQSADQRLWYMKPKQFEVALNPG